MKTTLAANTPARTEFWLKLGRAGFVFFLVKGLLWLGAPVLYYYLT